MSEWQPIETAPEATTILCLRGTEYGVDQFEWRTRSEKRLMRENGNQRTYVTDEWKEQEFKLGWGWTHWMPLPPPPTSTGDGT